MIPVINRTFRITVVKIDLRLNYLVFKNKIAVILN